MNKLYSFSRNKIPTLRRSSAITLIETCTIDGVSNGSHHYNISCLLLHPAMFVRTPIIYRALNSLKPSCTIRKFSLRTRMIPAFLYAPFDEALFKFKRFLLSFTTPFGEALFEFTRFLLSFMHHSKRTMPPNLFFFDALRHGEV